MFSGVLLVSVVLSCDPWLLLSACVYLLALSILELRFGVWVLGWFWISLFMSGPGVERKWPYGLVLVLYWGWQ